VKKSHKKIVVFSGSGMSAESGISTFRDNGGLWEEYRIEEVATPEAWKRDPQMVQNFYNLRRKQILEALPNSAWFGESVPMLEEARKEIEKSDIFIVIGTSLQVYPAAGLIHYAPEGALKFLIDPNAGELSVPKGFICIQQEATYGIQTAINMIKEKGDHL